MLRALSLVGSARVLSTGAQAVTLLLVARHLQPALFAQFAAVLGGLTALNIAADGGATYAVGRHHGSPGTIVEVLRAGRLLSSATLAVSVPALVGLAVTTGSPVLMACLPLCLWVPLERQLEVNSAYLLARGQDSLVGLLYLLRRLPTLVVIVILPAGVSAAVAYSVTMTLTAGVAMLVVAGPVRACVAATARRGGSPVAGGGVLPARRTWSMLRPFWAAIAGQGVRQLDVAVLTGAAGTAAAGLLAPASRLVPALLLVPGTYTQLLLGRLSATGERLTTRSVLVVGAVTAVVFGCLAATAPVWLPLLLGAAYTPSVPVVQVVVAGLVFATVSSAYASALHAGDRSSRVALSVWTGAVVSLLLVAVLGARFGPMGAAWAVLGGYGLQCGLMAAFHRRMRSPLVPAH